MNETLINIKDILESCFGILVLILYFPFYLLFLGIVLLWDYLDRSTKGQPRTGFIFKLCSTIHDKLQNKLQHYVMVKEDSYIILVIFYLSVLLPSLLILSAYTYISNPNLLFPIFIIYHAIRIGPSQINFSMVQSLSHKEGHAGSDQFKNLNNFFKTILGNSMCWWIGPFFGILPYSFKIGHSINHHKYNNSSKDVINNSDMRRDSLINYTRYITRFFKYSSNITLIPQFIKENQYNNSLKLFIGFLYTFCIYALFIKYIGFQFTFAIIFYPFLENVINISGYNWTWHAFIDPENPENDYANSITIVNGSYNMIDRDLHVVHHKYPAIHWSKYRALYNNDQQSYLTNSASLFENTEARHLFFMIIFSRYEQLASKFIFPKEITEQSDKIAFIQRRLRSITWGKDQNVAIQNSNQKNNKQS